MPLLTQVGVPFIGGPPILVEQTGSPEGTDRLGSTVPQSPRLLKLGGFPRTGPPILVSQSRPDMAPAGTDRLGTTVPQSPKLRKLNPRGGPPILVEQLGKSVFAPAGTDRLGGYVNPGGVLLMPLQPRKGPTLKVEQQTQARPANSDWPINVEPGAYSVSGAPASFLRTYVLNAASGSYAVSGNPAALLLGRLLKANPGAYALSGDPATLLRSLVIKAIPGAYGVTGDQAEFEDVLSAAPGSYTLTGYAAALVKTTRSHGGLAGAAISLLDELRKKQRRDEEEIAIAAISLRKD